MGIKDDVRIGNLSGVAYPSRLMRRIQGQLGTSRAMNLDSLLEDAKAVNGVAAAMERALEAGTNASGQVDMKIAAIHLIREMRKNQK